jgi:hypothetical protein
VPLTAGHSRPCKAHATDSALANHGPIAYERLKMVQIFGGLTFDLRIPTMSLGHSEIMSLAVPT